jgi:hypothetical protein
VGMGHDDWRDIACQECYLQKGDTFVWHKPNTNLKYTTRDAKSAVSMISETVLLGGVQTIMIFLEI